MFKSAVLFVLLVAAAQARDLQQDDAANKQDANNKVALGWSCRRTQFPPKFGCNYE